MTLTPGESQLVQFLAAHPGEAFLHADIAAAIGSQTSVPKNLVRVRVCNIRRKRPDIGRNIVSVYGGGFRWMGATDVALGA